jgi:hypothetical protein
VSGRRFKVATVSGYATMGSSFQRHGPGLSAHVLDTLNGGQVVASFRSEDATGVRADGTRLHQARRRGRDGARRDAEALAAEWNADEGRACLESPVVTARAVLVLTPDSRLTLDP